MSPIIIVEIYFFLYCQFLPNVFWNATIMYIEIYIQHVLLMDFYHYKLILV